MGIKSESYKRKIHIQLYIWEWIREAIEDLRFGKKIISKRKCVIVIFSMLLSYCKSLYPVKKIVCMFNFKIYNECVVFIYDDLVWKL